LLRRFYLLSPHTSYAGDYTWQGDAQSGCEQILKDTGIAKDEWQMGTTKAFIKNPETVSFSFLLFYLSLVRYYRCVSLAYTSINALSVFSSQLFALETMRDRYWHNMAGRIQRAWRNYIRYRNECATRIQRFWRKQKDGIEYARFRQTGHDLLGGRKERRRFSLVSYRRFAGDYLDVGGKSASGGVLRDAAGLTGESSNAEGLEELVFSELTPVLFGLGLCDRFGEGHLQWTSRASQVSLRPIVEAESSIPCHRSFILSS
jgi:myosin-1